MPEDVVKFFVLIFSFVVSGMTQAWDWLDLQWSKQRKDRSA